MLASRCIGTGYALENMGYVNVIRQESYNHPVSPHLLVHLLVSHRPIRIGGEIFGIGGQQPKGGVSHRDD